MENQSASNFQRNEVAKVQKRVPGWFKKPWQINSTILNFYMELASNSMPVSADQLRAKGAFNNNIVIKVDSTTFLSSLKCN